MLQIGDHYLPLHRACARKDIQKVGRMLARNAMVNVNEVDHLKQTPLHIAVKKRCIAIVFQLLDYGGADLDVKDTFGKTPLMYASENNDCVSLTQLLARRADPNSSDAFRTTPLIVASKCGFDMVVKRLVRDSRLLLDHPDHLGATAVWYAAHHGNLEILRMLLRLRANPNVKDVHDKTPLIAAAESGHLLCVERLLECTRTTIDHQDKFGLTALQYACKKNLTHVAQALIEGGAYTRGRSPLDQTTLLMTASHHGNVGLATLLLQSDRLLPCVNALDGGHRTALYYGCRHPGIVALLLSQGAEPDCMDQSGKSPLMRAAETGCVKVLQLLLDCQVNLDAIDTEGYTAFTYACVFGRLEAALLLLQAGASPLVADIDDQTPLMLAAHHNHAEIVELLLTCQLDVGINYRDFKGTTALAKACMRGQPDLVALLLEHGASPLVEDKGGVTPLMRACNHSDVGATQALLDHDATNVDARDVGMQTALFHACAEDAVECVKLLLAKKADPSLANKQGITPMMLACSSGSPEIVQALADAMEAPLLNLQDAHGQTALSRACETGGLAVVRVLLHKGANLTIPCNRLLTPLMLASSQGSEEIVEALLIRADPSYVDLVDWQHMTALYHASLRGHLGAVTTLLKHGANALVVSETRSSPLLVAAEQGLTDIVEQLILSVRDSHAQRRYVNECDDALATPLHQAATFGYRDTVECLLRYGASLCSVDEHGNTPLTVACLRKETDVVSLLLQHATAADINHVNYHGKSALYHAIATQNMDLLDLLHRHGALVQPLFDSGAIWKAGYPQYVSMPMLRCLVDSFGVPVDAFNRQGRNALYMLVASYVDATEAVAFLLSRGANPWLTGRDGLLPVVSASHHTVQCLLKNAMYEHERFRLVEKARALHGMYQRMDHVAYHARTRDSKRIKCIPTAPKVLRERLAAAEKLPTLRFKEYPSKLHGVLTGVIECANDDVFRELFEMMKVSWDS
jgi:ankyrin repeat protein